jgi:hypothetical protein
VVAAEVADEAEGEGRNAVVRWPVALSAMSLLRLVVSQVPKAPELLSLAIASRDDLAGAAWRLSHAEAVMALADHMSHITHNKVA